MTEDPRKTIERLGPWFHNLHLPDGAQTRPDHPLGDYPSFKWQKLAAILPHDLTGWKVLDVGCNAGFYSFELARRGALVTGVDREPLYLNQARWAAEYLGLSERVEFRELDVYDLGRIEGQFDLVLFMGVFYHLRHPLLGLELVCEKVGRLLIFQTLSLPGDEEETPVDDLALDERRVLLRPGWPKMAFIEHKIDGDPTNWWVPNHAAVVAILRSVGQRVVARPGDEIYLCEPWERTR